MDARGRLVASRPAAIDYARTLAEVPGNVTGLAGTVGAATIYPVKGLGGVEPGRVRVDRLGLMDPATGLRDRSVMLAFRKPGISPEGAFDVVSLSNRLEGAMSLVRGRVEDGALVYEAPGVAPLRIDPADLAPRAGEAVRIKLYEGGPIIAGEAREDALAQWVRSLLRAHPMPRRFAPEDVVAVVPSLSHQRPVSDKHRAGQEADTLFGDGAHALVASSSTLSWMNASLRSQRAREIPMSAFRPNVVVEGLPPNAEDLIGEIEIVGPEGPVRVLFATMCVRCDATRVDPATGLRPDAQPLAWLAKNRPPRDGDGNSATFAVNAVFPAASRGRSFGPGDAVRVVRGA